MMKKRSVRLNNKGFTLVELLVVIAILALLAGIGVPQVMRTLARSRVVADLTAIETVQSALDAFRSETGATAAECRTTGEKTIATTFSKASLIGEATNPTIANYLEGGVLPTLKSQTGTVYWCINDAGQVYISSSAAGALLTPGLPPTVVTP